MKCPLCFKEIEKTTSIAWSCNEHFVCYDFYSALPALFLYKTYIANVTHESSNPNYYRIRFIESNKYIRIPFFEVKNENQLIEKLKMIRMMY